MRERESGIEVGSDGEVFTRKGFKGYEIELQSEKGDS